MSSSLPKVKLISTGGTIAMKRDEALNAFVPALSGDDLLAAVSGLSDVADVQVVNLFNTPSAHFSEPEWRAIHAEVEQALNEEEVAGVIITHGTDTLEETAWFLDLTIKHEKPVVLVGAQRNSSLPGYDGPANLLAAVRVAVAGEAREKGTMVVMNGQINAAREVTKTHTSYLESFQSGEHGFLGSVDLDRVVFYRSPLQRQHIELAHDSLPRVEIIPMFAGADGSMIRAAVSYGAKGLVIAALGVGNVNISMLNAIKQAITLGIPVVISTRVHGGRVGPFYGFEGGGKTLEEAGAIFADNLSPHKVRILLMLAMQNSEHTGSLLKLGFRGQSLL